VSEALLSVENAHVSYGRISALKGVSFTVYRGEIVTLIGANGAGKTSALMAISGIVPLASGKISFAGDDLTALAAHKITARGLAHVPEGRKIFPRLTVQENLDMGAYLRKDSGGVRRDLERVFALFPVLAERRAQSGGTLSGGEQQMLAIGRALMSAPKMLLMDEPSMGVAPLIVKKIFGAIAELNKQGLTVFLVEQNAHAALRLARRGYVMETGSIVIEDESAKILANPKVRAAYLGESE
jgi:branched-chain amino acid transport system ATP-binding protein